MKGYNHGKPITDATRRKMAEASRRTRNGFKKGHPVFMKAHSQEAKNKIRLAALADGRKPSFQGRKHTPESREKLRISHLGNNSGSGNRGRITPIPVRLKLSRSLSGSKGPGWKGGVSVANSLIRNSIEATLWREAVFARDNWTCQKYGIKGGRLHAHHIQNFAQFPELRFAIDNGVTLSEKAHREFHKKYGIRNNTREQLNEFLSSVV